MTREFVASIVYWLDLETGWTFQLAKPGCWLNLEISDCQFELFSGCGQIMGSSADIVAAFGDLAGNLMDDCDITGDGRGNLRCFRNTEVYFVDSN